MLTYTKQTPSISTLLSTTTKSKGSLIALCNYEINPSKRSSQMQYTIKLQQKLKYIL